MKNVLLILLSVCSLCACGQKEAVKKAYIFYMQRMPGNIPVDDNGKPLKGVDTVRYIYLECHGIAKPIIDEVWIGRKCYTAVIEPVDELPAKLKAQKGNLIWKGELLPYDPGHAHTASKNITVSGRMNGRSFKKNISRATRLEAEERY